VPEHAAGQCMDDIRSNTTFRPNPVTGTLLNDAGFEAPHRCVLERESDEKEVAMRIESTTFGAITIDGKTYEHDVVIRLSGEVVKRKKNYQRSSMVPRTCFQKTRQNSSSRKGATRSSLALVRWATYHRKLKPISKERAARSC